MALSSNYLLINLCVYIRSLVRLPALVRGRFLFAVGGGFCRDAFLLKVRKNGCEQSTIEESISLRACPGNSRDIAEEGAEGTGESKDREESREPLSSGHDVPSAHMTLQQLWCPAQDKAHPNFQHGVRVRGRRRVGCLPGPCPS